MKRFVSKEQKVLAPTLVVLFSLMLVFETGQAILLLACLVITGVLLKVEENPPRWLLRTPIGRWLRR